jgi:DUF2934 family protein
MRKGKDLSSPSSATVSRYGGSARSERGFKGQSDGSFIDQVRQRAYELYEKRVTDNAAGDPMSDWLSAEEQVRLELTRGNGTMS